jgi:transposase-like protein
VDTDQSKLIFGSDEEFAAVKALNLCFPRATRVFCAKHLKDNAIDKHDWWSSRRLVNQIKILETNWCQITGT